MTTKKPTPEETEDTIDQSDDNTTETTGTSTQPHTVFDQDTYLDSISVPNRL